MQLKTGGAEGVCEGNLNNTNKLAETENSCVMFSILQGLAKDFRELSDLTDPSDILQVLSATVRKTMPFFFSLPGFP